MIQVDASPSPRTVETAARRLQLQIELERGHDSALLRVFSTLHRRRCRVVEVAFEEATGRLALAVEAPQRQAPQVAAWLRSLVDVRGAVLE